MMQLRRYRRDADGGVEEERLISMENFLRTQGLHLIHD